MNSRQFNPLHLLTRFTHKGKHGYADGNITSRLTRQNHRRPSAEKDMEPDHSALARCNKCTRTSVRFTLLDAVSTAPVNLCPGTIFLSSSARYRSACRCGA